MGRARTRGLDYRLIPCACGCGELIPNYDKQLRPRRYVLGHKHTPITSKYHFDNPTVMCKCGCGSTMPLYSTKGVKRSYVKGHARRKINDPLAVKHLIDVVGTPNMVGSSLNITGPAIRNFLKRNGVEYYTDLLKVGGTTSFGRKAEFDALQLLTGSQDATCNDPHKSPYDLSWKGLRVNVKASTVKESGKNTRWSFRTHGHNQCDYLLCLGYVSQQVELALLIPSNSVLVQTISVPITKDSKWMKYDLAI